MNSTSDTITVFLCQEDPDSILTAVYEAWASRLGHSHVRLELADSCTPALFCRYRTVTTDPDKAAKVARSIRTKISGKAWQWVYRAALSPEASRADDIYRFLTGGFYFGGRVTDMLTEPAVRRIHDLNRFVGNEAHYYREFLRFEACGDQLLVAKIRPKSDVLPLLTPHFCDRISGENFAICDIGRGTAAIHPSQRDLSRRTLSPDNFYLVHLTPEQMSSLEVPGQDAYRDLWKIFFDAVAIEERKNPELQRNRMPLRYREFAPEFE